MNKTILVLIGVLVLAGGAYAFSANEKAEMAAKQEMMKQEEMMKEAEMMDKEMMDDESMMKDEMDAAMDAEMKKDDMMDKEMMDDESMMKDDKMEDAAMMKPGSYEAYSADKLARAETGDVVLFFHASWCPSCRNLSANIEGNLAAIPENVSILKVDYDTATELKQKYGVTSQHTLVQVAADGTLIKKWSGSASLAAVVGQIQ